MSDICQPTVIDPASLKQLTPEQLVSVVMQQQAVIMQQQAVIAQLQREIDQLKGRQYSDSQTSSKPPSSDLLKK